MITYTDVISWLKKMPKERVACRNLSDPTQNILMLYSRDVLNFRGHKASNRCVYTREGAGPMTVLTTVQPELTAVLGTLDDQEDLSLCITAGALIVVLQDAYRKSQEHVEPAAALC